MLVIGSHNVHVSTCFFFFFLAPYTLVCNTSVQSDWIDSVLVARQEPHICIFFPIYTLGDT